MLKAIQLKDLKQLETLIELLEELSQDHSDLLEAALVPNKMREMLRKIIFGTYLVFWAFLMKSKPLTVSGIKTNNPRKP